MAGGLVERIKNGIQSPDVGIDLGTANILVYVKDRGIVLREPSVAVVKKDTDEIVKLGHAALKMIGRTPENLEVVRPLREGVIDKYKVTLQMVDHLIRRACGSAIIKPRVMVCIPTGATEVEECAVIDAATGREIGEIQLKDKREYTYYSDVAVSNGDAYVVEKEHASDRYTVTLTIRASAVYEEGVGYTVDHCRVAVGREYELHFPSYAGRGVCVTLTEG